MKRKPTAPISPQSSATVQSSPTAPQALTERYVTNLVNTGKNKDYTLIGTVRRSFVADEVLCGHYYDVTVANISDESVTQSASGATPTQAVRRALKKLGVTFR